MFGAHTRHLRRRLVRAATVYTLGRGFRTVADDPAESPSSTTASTRISGIPVGPVAVRFRTAIQRMSEDACVGDEISTAKSPNDRGVRPRSFENRPVAEYRIGCCQSCARNHTGNLRPLFPGVPWHPESPHVPRRQSARPIGGLADILADRFVFATRQTGRS
jgi:hypothetical protein